MGCAGCARYLLIAFNIIFFLIGAVALGIGIWVAIDATIFLNVLENIPNSSAYGKLISDAAYILIAGGAFIFLVSFLGCCGAWKKVKCLLITYAIIIGILFVLEIGVVVVAYFFYDKVSALFRSELSAVLGNNQTYTSTFAPISGKEWSYSSKDIISKGVDALQLKFSCCGVNNYTDYNGNYPVTCCPLDAGALTLSQLVDEIWGGEAATLTVMDAQCPTNVSYVENVKGCYDELYTYVTDRSIIFIGIAGGTAGLQIFLIILSCCLYNEIKKSEEYA